MVRHTEKGVRFEDIIERADRAIEENYGIEGGIIYFAIIEDRVSEILKILAPNEYTSKESFFNKLNRLINLSKNGKICLINQNEKNNQNYSNNAVLNLFKTEFDITLLENIDRWRESRNSIIHAYASENITYTEVMVWSTQGKEYGRLFLSSCMRFKKKIKRIEV